MVLASLRDRAPIGCFRSLVIRCWRLDPELPAPLTQLFQPGIPGSLFLALAKDIMFASYATLWFRLVFYSGLYGIYASTLVRFDLWGLLQALAALFIGYHYSKAVNALYYFVFDNRYSGLPKAAPRNAT